MSAHTERRGRPLFNRLCAPLEFGLTVRADDELVRPPVCLQALRLPDVTACCVACVFILELHNELGIHNRAPSFCSGLMRTLGRSGSSIKDKSALSDW